MGINVGTHGKYEKCFFCRKQFDDSTELVTYQDQWYCNDTCVEDDKAIMQEAMGDYHHRASREKK